MARTSHAVHTLSFEDCLRRYVERYAQRTQRSQKAIAQRLHYSPSMLSHILAGRRKVRDRQTLIHIGVALELDLYEIGDLLHTADLRPLDEWEVRAQLPEQSRFYETIARSVVQGVASPEQELLYRAVVQDTKLISDMWGHYAALPQRLYRRQWQSIEDEVERGIQEYYGGLRKIGARFLARLNSAKATSLEHQNRFGEAENACLQGLVAADYAGDLNAKCMLLARLGTLHKLQSRLGRAAELYEEALGVYESWRSQAGARPEAAETEWWEHMWARTRRMQGTLYLFMGRPHDALHVLQEAVSYFGERAGRSDVYELSQAYYSLGWATRLLGEWDAALDHDSRGLAMTEGLNEERGWYDARSLLQGYLYLGGDYLDRNDFENAERWLLRASETAQANDACKEYHERGRVDLLLGKLYSSVGDVDQASRYIAEGLRFYLSRTDLVRLAGAYNILGGSMLRKGDAQGALESFQNAMRCASTVEPPNYHYAISAQVNWCAALLKSEESNEGISRQLIPTMAALEALCIGKGFPQHLARLKVVEAQAMRRLADFQGMALAGREALRHACRFNRFLVEDVWKGLSDVALPSEQRREMFASLHEEVLSMLEMVGQLPDAQIRETLVRLRARSGG